MPKTNKGYKGNYFPKCIMVAREYVKCFDCKRILIKNKYCLYCDTHKTKFTNSKNVLCTNCGLVYIKYDPNKKALCKLCIDKNHKKLKGLN